MKKLNTLSPYILFAVLTLMSLAYGYFKIYNFKPYGIHYWRQSDCVSYAANYYQKDLPFLKPEIYWLGSTQNGATVSEFPILYFITGKIWQFTGQKEFVLRMINMLIVFAGLFYLFRLFSEHLKDRFWSLISVVFLFTSPILVNYTNNFLSDAPAFGLGLIGVYYLWKYYNSFILRYLYIASFLYLFAGLLKISALIGILAVIPIHIYMLIFDKERKVKINSFLPFAILFSGITLWYSYAIHYNENNVSGVFLQGILPIWEFDHQQIEDIFSAFRKNLIPAFFNKYALIIMGLLLLYIFVKIKRTNKYLMSYFLFLIFGVIGYFILFFQVFNVHDYYLTNMLIIIPVFMFLGLDLMKNSYRNILNNRYLKTIVSLFAIVLIILTAQINRQKFFSSEKDLIVKNGIYKVDQIWEWNHFDYNNRFKALESIKPYLKEIGLKKDDKIISIPDDTPNFSLYMMGYKGWSDYVYPPKRNEEIFNEHLKLGAKYLVVNDTTIFTEREFLQKYTKKLFGQHKNVFIYKLN